MRINTNTIANDNLLKLYQLLGDKHTLPVKSSAPKSPLFPVSTRAEEIEEQLKADDDSTGYPWIDNFKWKRDSTGPLTKAEQEWVAAMKSSMRLTQEEYDAWGWNKRAETYLDEDGYPLNGFVMDAKQKLKEREELNREVSNIFSSNGISVSNNEKFTLTIDFNDYITVSGLNDTSKAKSIESALNNDSSLSRSLLRRVLRASMNGTSQATANERLKYNTNRELKSKTGYGVDDLVFGADGIRTKDGADVLQLYRNAAAKDFEGSPFAATETAAVVRGMSDSLNRLNIAGINKIPDILVRIDYEHGGFIDYGTDYGFGKGQTAWIDEMMSLRGSLDKLSQYVERFMTDVKPIYAQTYVSTSTFSVMA